MPKFLKAEGLEDLSYSSLVKLIKRDWTAIEEVENPSEELQLIAVKQNINAFKLIDNPSKEVQLFVIEQDPENFYSIKNKHPDVDKIFQKRGDFDEYLYAYYVEEDDTTNMTKKLYESPQDLVDHLGDSIDQLSMFDGNLEDYISVKESTEVDHQSEIVYVEPGDGETYVILNWNPPEAFADAPWVTNPSESHERYKVYFPHRLINPPKLLTGDLG